MRFIIHAATREDGLLACIHNIILMYNTRRYELRPADQGGLRRVRPFTRVSQKQSLEEKNKENMPVRPGTPVQVSRDVSDSREHMVAITQRPPNRRLVYN